jgi:hypothetical protein
MKRLLLICITALALHAQEAKTAVVKTSLANRTFVVTYNYIDTPLCDHLPCASGMGAEIYHATTSVTVSEMVNGSLVKLGQNMQLFYTPTDPRPEMAVQRAFETSMETGWKIPQDIFVAIVGRLLERAYMNEARFRITPEGQLIINQAGLNVLTSVSVNGVVITWAPVGPRP